MPGAFTGVPMSGRTDPLIITDACARCGVALDGKRDHLIERYVDYLTHELPRDVPGKRVLPGVVPLLDALHTDPGAILALLTGNLEPSARLKLEEFDLWRYFETGAFGDDAPERNGLVAVALSRVAALGYPSLPADHILVIGDTPHDVACARAAGVRSLAVATGTAAAWELEAAGADAVVPDLGETEAILALIRTLVGESMSRT